MSKGYLWKGSYLDGDNVRQDVYVVSEEPLLSSGSAFHSVAEIREGKVMVLEDPSGGQKVVDNFVELSQGEIEVVHYNHSTGNTVILNAVCDQTQEYWYEFIGYEVKYATDDFEPFSPGATYMFRCPWGNEEFVVGQTYEYDGYDDPIEFEGYFGVHYDSTEDPRVPSYIHMFPQGACEVSKDIDGVVDAYCRTV